MLCAFIVMKCEGFTQITDLADYLENNRLIAHYCGFDIMRPLPSYWTYDRFLRKLPHDELAKIMAQQVQQLYEIGIVDTSFIGLDSTPISANTGKTIPNPLPKTSLPRTIIQSATRTALWVFIPHPISTTNGDTSFTGAIRIMCWWTVFPACRSMR